MSAAAKITATRTMAASSRMNDRPAQVTEEMHLQVQGVTKFYGARATHPVDIAFQKGEFVSVVGPSGCGKTTLLDIVAGLIEPSDGTVTFEGRPVHGEV